MKETLTNLLRQRPFQPFTVTLSSGQTFEVCHPEIAALTKSNLLVAQPDSDDVAYCALLHVANVTTSTTPAS